MLLGCDTPIGVAVLRELGRDGVPVHAVGRSPRSPGRASRHATGFTLRPAGPLADWLPALVDRTGTAALFAIAEHDLIELAALKDALPGCHVLTPDAGPLAKVLDKSATLAAAAAIGIDTPATLQPDASGARWAGRWPVVLKWADPAAAASAGIDIVKTEFARDRAELDVALARYDANRQWPLVQEYAPGIGLAQMLFVADGRATLRFQHRRVHEMPPEGGVSTLCAAVPLTDHTAQLAKSEALLAAIGWEGPAMVEYRFDPVTGRYVLMEINGRFWGGQPLALASGARFALEGYRRAVLGQTGDAPPPRDGRSARFLVPDTRRLLRVLAGKRSPDPFYRPTPLADLGRWLAAFIDPRTGGYLWDWRDPGPALADLRNMALSALRR